MNRTGIIDRAGAEICEGDRVSLAGNITVDNSFGELPNGFIFDDSDIYPVYWDELINTWSLRLGVEPDSPYNRKYMNHAVSLLHDGAVTVVSPNHIA